nr:receptor-like protein 12 [Quercus suber]
MAASFATLHVLFLVWFLPATFSLSFFFFFKAEAISNVSCYEKDKQALLTLKRGLTDHGHVLSSWSDHKDCCIWDGVFCDNKIGRVSELHLNYSRLGGEISAWEPFKPRYLSLGSNSDLYVDNLRWMSGLSAIQYLDLSLADLHREVDWLQIMSKFPSLSKLYLQNCQLDSLNPSLGFVNFTSLRSLDLSGNHFNHEIPNWFTNLSTSFLRLDLYNNSLKGNILPSIFNLEKLEYLDLGLNSLNGPIPSCVGNLSHIRALYLDQNQLNGTIPESLWLLSKLESLYVGTNSLTDEILLPYTKRINEAQELPQEPRVAPCQSGLDFAVGMDGQPTNRPGNFFSLFSLFGALDIQVFLSHSLGFQFCTSVLVIGAHDTEILSLSFSLSSKKEANFEEAADSQSFLALGGCD